MSAQDFAMAPPLKAVPILPSLNFTQTRDFYVQCLGFQEVAPQGADYMILRRGALELHFWLSEDPLQCQNSLVYFRSAAINEVQRDFRARGVEAISASQPGEEGAQADVQFHVRDPHGNLLMFAGTGAGWA